MFYSRIASGVHYPWDILVWVILWKIFWLCFYKIYQFPKIKVTIDNANIKIIKLISYIKL
jgi:membrane-associated phospholipid phosphatase